MIRKILKYFPILFLAMGYHAYGALQMQLHSVDIRGVPPGPLPELVYKTIASYQNRYISIPELKVLQRNIILAYHKEGYFLSTAKLVPAKFDLKKADLIFDVTGGKIGRFSIKGEFPGASFWQLKRYLLELKNDYPLNINHVQKYLLLINEMPGIKARATMYPGESAKKPDMVVDISTSRFQSFLLADNRISPVLGGYNLTAGGALYRLLGSDRLFVTGTADPSFYRNINGTLAYDVTFGSFGGHFVSTFSYSKTQPISEGEDKPLVNGTGLTYDFQYNMPLIYSRNRVRFYTGMTRVQSNSLYIEAKQKKYDDKITKAYIGLKFTWTKLWRLRFLRYGWISGDARAEQGLPLLTNATPAHPSAPKGTPVFTKFIGSISTQQFITSHWDVSMGGKMQFASTDLLASEKMGYGGSDYGQAFLPFAYIGDEGLLGRVATEYDFPIVAGRINFHVTPFVFFDTGYLSNNYRNVVTNAANTSFGMSAGGGMKLFTTRFGFGNINASVEYGVPIHAETDQNLYFTVGYVYG